MEELFARFADVAGLLVEIVAVLVVAFGAADLAVPAAGAGELAPRHG